MFEAIKNFSNFTGRASRKEFWLFHLLTIIFTLLCSIIAIFTTSNYIAFPLFIVYIFFLIAFLSVNIRRLHDIDKKGWWLLIILVPIIGPLILLYWALKKGTPGNNRFGEDPLTQVT